MDPKKLADAYHYDIYNTNNLTPGDHICALHMNQDDFKVSIVNYIAKGLELNEKIIYIAESHFEHSVRTYLEAAQVDCFSALIKGQLNFVNSNQRKQLGKHDVANKMIAMLQAECNKAFGEGYKTLRVGGDVCSVLKNFAHLDEFLEYEYLLNEKILKQYSFLCFCQYDVNAFSYSFLNKVLEVHSVCHIGTKGYPNQYYIPPELNIEPNRDKNIFMYRLDKIREKTEMEVAATRLYAKNVELCQLSEMVAHDLKEPIKTAAFMNTLLSSEHSDKLSSQTHYILTKMQNSLKVASSRIDSIQEITDVTKRKIKFGNINVNRSIYDAIESYEARVKEVPGKFVFVPQPIKVLKADRADLNQLLFNIFDNCIMYRERSKKLIIEITAASKPNL